MSDRIVNDFYPTPPNAIDPFIKRILKDQPKGFARILEPACGDGAIVRRLQALMPGVKKIVGVDIDDRRIDESRQMTEGNVEFHQGDFLSRSVEPFDLIITNPPFEQLMEFVEHALTYQTKVAIFARLAFLEGVGRASFHQKHPSDVFVLDRRPIFRSDKRGSDRWAYAWFAWGFGGGRWEILPTKTRMPSKSNVASAREST